MRLIMIHVLFLSAFFARATNADCPCVPLSHQWIVKTCSDWNCASTELLLAGGDPQLFVVPVAMKDARWLVLRRLTAGAAVDASNDPFWLQQFDGMQGAINSYAKLTYDLHPMMMTAPDGQVLVIALKQAESRRRAAAP